MISDRHLNVSHPLTGNQRAVDDVLVRVTATRGDGTGTVMFMSWGRAAMALARYPRTGLASNPNQRFVVERLGPKQEAS